VAKRRPSRQAMCSARAPQSATHLFQIEAHVTQSASGQRRVGPSCLNEPVQAGASLCCTHMLSMCVCVLCVCACMFVCTHVRVRVCTSPWMVGRAVVAQQPKCGIGNQSRSSGYQKGEQNAQESLWRPQRRQQTPPPRGSVTQ